MENSFANLSVCQGILIIIIIIIQIRRIRKNDNVRTLNERLISFLMFIDWFNATRNAFQSNAMLNKCALTLFSFFFYREPFKW